MTHRQGLLLLLVLLACGPLIGHAQNQNQGAAAAQDQTWTPNFNNTDILEVIRAVQDATGRTIVVDPRVRGAITVMTDTPVDREAYYGIFLRALDVNGFTAVEREDGVVTIVPTNQVRAESLPFASSQVGPNNYVTEVIQLHNVAAAQVLPAIRPLVSTGNAQMTAYPPSNVLIVVDTMANVERIRQLVERIDQAATPETETVKLEYADAEEMVRILREIAREDAAAAQGGASTQLQLTADKRTNSVLVTGEQRQRERIKDLIVRLDLPQPQTGNARVVYLEYASAVNVAERLNNVVQNLARISSDTNAEQALAAVEADEDTNSVIITADIDTVNSLMGIIERLDVQRAQVLVEAIIVEITDDIGKNLGIQWLFRHEDGGFASSFDAGNDPRALALIAESALDTDDRDALTGLAAALAGMAGQTIGVGRLTSSNDLLAIIDLLQATSGANILSTPNLLTTDNTPARITVGESVPFITGSYTTPGDTGSIQNPFQTISRENVGTTLEVTPHVNRGNKVAMDIRQEISSISQRAGAVDLITNERQIETRVTVADGETVVLGGLIRDNVIQSETRVPLLGSIPVLGHLFRSQSSSVQKTNLLVFIRPTILRDDETLRGATALKYNFIRDRQLEQRNLSRLLTKRGDLPVLPEWESILPEATTTTPTTEQEDEDEVGLRIERLRIDDQDVEVSAQ